MSFIDNFKTDFERPTWLKLLKRRVFTMKYCTFISLWFITLMSCTSLNSYDNELVGKSYVKQFVGNNWIDTTQLLFITKDYVQVKNWSWIEDEYRKLEWSQSCDNAKTLKYKVDGNFVIIECENSVESYLIGKDNLKSEDNELYILEKGVSH